MITQKRDYRRRKYRKIFFSLKFIPLLFILIIFLFFIVGNRNNIINSTNPNFDKGLSGAATSSLSMTDRSYSSEENLKGNFRIYFDQGDFLPLDTKVKFVILATSPIYYVCSNGNLVDWYYFNGTMANEYPYQLCGESNWNFPSCEGSGKECCEGVAGKNYGNLNCSQGLGYCGDYCVNQLRTFNLNEIISKSKTPLKGNFTNFTYMNNSNSSIFGNQFGYGVGYCYETTGASEPNSLMCNDTDNGIDFSVKGTCNDIYGTHLEDSCNGNTLMERYCISPPRIMFNECSECINVNCRKQDESKEGWYADCPNVGGVTQEFLIEYMDCHALSQAYVPICLYNSTDSEGWYHNSYCNNLTEPCQDSCSQGICTNSTVNINCSGWTNYYEIDLGNFGLKAPKYGANYTFYVDISWNNTLLSEFLTSFSVNQRLNHRACVNNACVFVSGEGEDECHTNLTCACNPNWDCSSWGSCVNYIQYRVCNDLEGCLPQKTESQSCTPECVPSWGCSWQQCQDPSQNQQEICVDSMNCDPNNLNYIQETRACCIEDWKCEKWSKCQNNSQTRTCQDLKNCDTVFNKPNETRTCQGFVFPDISKISLVYILIILGLAVVIVVLIIILKVINKKTKESIFENIDKLGTSDIKGDVKLRPGEDEDLDFLPPPPPP
jgi:hypothetical protein